MNVYKFKVPQGVLHVTADSKKAAEKQERSFRRDVNRYWVRQQTEIKPGVFALGSLAKSHLGVQQRGAV